MQDPLKQAAAVEDADVQKQFTQVLLLEELMELNVNTCNLECKDPNLVVPNEDYRISIPVLQGDHLDIVSSASLSSFLKQPKTPLISSCLRKGFSP